MTSIEQKMLSMVDVEGIIAVISKVTGINKNSIDIDQYLTHWAANKKDLFVLFGEKLKIEKDVELDLSANINTVKSKQQSFLEEVMGQDYNLFKPYMLLSNLSPYEFVLNSFNYDRELFGVKFNKGDKVSRSISKLFSKEDKGKAGTITTKYSMVLQEFKAKGKAVLSIDPMDFFTMSENSSNWSSCHSLTGCYQTGTISYLQDPTTAISYVKPSIDVEIKYEGKIGEVKVANYSNKVWRQIVLFSSNLTYATQARQYPGPVAANQNTIADILMDLMSKKNQEEYRVCTWTPGDVYHSVFRSHESYNGDYCYNDIENEAFSTAYSIIPASVDDIDDFFTEKLNNRDRCRVGTSVRCITGCGCYADDNESFFCDDCR